MILIGDIFEKIGEIADNSVHCAITSPPYWGLRDYGMVGQIGLEASLPEFVEKMVAVFREVRRVLRPDGVCFLNLGDSYNGSGGAGGDYGPGGIKEGQPKFPGRKISQLKVKDLCGVPWRVALALQDDGWYLRSDIIWAKPNPMPESVTDRPTKSHEYIFLLTKSAKYFWDQEAVREKAEWERWGKQTCLKNYRNIQPIDSEKLEDKKELGRNIRSVWTIPTESFSDAHFATYPQKLVETCIKAGTSEHGCCPKCGKQWIRQIKIDGKEICGNPHGKNQSIIPDRIDLNQPVLMRNKKQTIGFKSSCSCNLDPIPCTVFDPFLGSGTTGLVAQKMGRRWLGIELNPKYAAMARKRLGRNLFEEENYG